MEERILTLHPQGKKGVNIVKSRYEMVKAAILEALKEQPGITNQELCEEVNRKIRKTFDGKVVWYVVTVKQDLKARGILEVIPKSKPQQLRLR